MESEPRLVDPPRALTDVVTATTISQLQSATRHRETFDILMGLLKQLPSPRAYLAVPFLISTFNERATEWLWEEGRQALSAELMFKGVSVITPESINCLGFWNANVISKDANPFLIPLMKQGVLDALYLPDILQEDETIQQTQTFYAAEKTDIQLLFWRPRRSRP